MFADWKISSMSHFSLYSQKTKAERKNTFTYVYIIDTHFYVIIV